MTEMLNENLMKRPVSKEHDTVNVKQNTKWSLLESIVAADQKWTASLSICAHEESPVAWLRPLMKVLEISFDGVLWLAGTVIMCLMTHRIQDIEILVNLFFLLILDLIVVCLAKLMFRRQRPSQNRMDMFATVSVDLFSFPSGHATRAAMVTCFLVHKVVKKRFAPFVIAFCCCLGLSRIMLGRHHVLDVFFGLLIIGILEYALYLPFWVRFLVMEDWLDDFLSHVYL